jgi:hypothetical protein
MIETKLQDIEFHRHCLSPPGRAASHDCVVWAKVYGPDDEVLTDYARQAEEVRTLLGADATRAMIDLGRGAGAFVLHAVRYYRDVEPTAVSDAMLRCARFRTGSARLTNVALRRGGSLTRAHAAEAVDVLVSVAALSHLPDFWKLVGSRRPTSVLRSNGGFHLLDVVTCVDLALYESRLQSFSGFVNGRAEDEAVPVTSLWAEYRTCHQIIEDVFRQCGFASEDTDEADELLAVYTCGAETPQKASMDTRARTVLADVRTASVFLPRAAVRR